MVQREQRGKRQEDKRRVNTQREGNKDTRGFFSALRVFSAAVLDYWKQEMAVTGDETESGKVPLVLLNYILLVFLS